MSQDNEGYRYFIFQCVYDDCKKEFPAIVPIYHNDILCEDLTLIDVRCLYCDCLNRLEYGDRIREIDKQSYESELRLIENKIKLEKMNNRTTIKWESELD